MHACITFIEAATESVAPLEHADAPFATDAPFLSSAEPALLLALSPLHTAGTQIGNPHLCDSQLLPTRFASGREKSSVAGDRLLHHVSGHLDALIGLLREALGLRLHLSGRAQQFAIALLQLFPNLRSTPAAGPSDLD